MTSQLPAFVHVVTFSSVYFVLFECKLEDHKGLNILSMNKTKVCYRN